MIRVLVTFPLNAKGLELLNEIPEFEVREKAGLSHAQMLEEIPQADALICGGFPRMTRKVLDAAAALKLIIPIGTEDDVDATLARMKQIEIRPVAAGSAGEALQVIAILKDFFNV